MAAMVMMGVSELLQLVEPEAEAAVEPVLMVHQIQINQEESEQVPGVTPVEQR